MIHQNKTEELLAGARKGDRKAMNHLMALWYKRIYHFLWRYTGSRVMAEEVCQLSFISVFKKMHQIKDETKFKSWLYRIALNEANYQFKYARRHETQDLSDARTLEVEAPDAQQQMELGEKVILVKRALMLLNPDQREVIILKEYESLKFREIALILNLPVNTVKSRMYYGLKTLKKTLQNHPIIKDMYNEAS